MQKTEEMKITMGDKVKVQEFDPDNIQLINTHYKGVTLARFGDIGTTIPISFKNDADSYRNMTVSPDDVWVATFPRSGTTWTQELVWLLLNNFDYETAEKIPLMARYLFLELSHLSRREEKKLKRLPTGSDEFAKIVPTFDDIVNAPHPRFFKTHLPFSLLPPDLLDTTKVVYVARDPRDVAVSFYHYNRVFVNYEGDFKSFWNLFINDLVPCTPYFPHLKEAWSRRCHPNMLLMFYEDMIKDLPSCVKKIAEFFNKVITKEQMDKLCEHLDIRNFKKNKSVNQSWISLNNPDVEGGTFVRNGKSGTWREQFDEEMTAQAQRWMRQNIADTDLRFPEVEAGSALNCMGTNET